MSDARVAGLERQLLELGNLYEIARGLIGLDDPAAIAAHAVRAAMGTLGARSAALLLAAPRRRLVAAFASGLDAEVPPLALDDGAWQWLADTRAARLVHARGLGPARARLAQCCDGVLAAPLPGRNGPRGLLVAGPHLFDRPYGDEHLATLESVATLAALALRRGAEPAADQPRREPRAGRHRHPALLALVGASAALEEACDDLVAVAPTRFPVLLQGESGVGKELAARALHQLSDRGAGPFEVVDCGSIPRELIESELFGHVRGSFTGAHRDRRGAFELAHRGTLFLDEIGEMPLQLQTRLLRVLQEGRYRRVGDERPVECDVRIVAATNRDLKDEVAAGRFRQDLYYRLNVFAVRIPPLRERHGDLPRLVGHFLAAAGRGDWEVEPAVIRALEAHDWPGNIRELGNLVATLAVRARGAARLDLPRLEEAWRRQYGGTPPWTSAAEGAPRGRLGAWALDQARASRFNLIEAARRLARDKRAGREVPVAERSALAYYVTGEILRALVETGGDAAAAARRVAGDPDLEPRVAARIERVRGALREAGGDPQRARRKFGKLPAEYATVVEEAARLGW